MTVEGRVAMVTGGASGPGGSTRSGRQQSAWQRVIWSDPTVAPGLFLTPAFRTVNQRGEVVLDRGVGTFARPLTSSAP